MKIITGKNKIFLIFLLVLFTVLAVNGFTAAGIEYDPSVLEDNDPFQLIDYQFDLLKNGKELESFSDEGKDKLNDLVSQYGQGENSLSLSEEENNDFVLEEGLEYNRLSFEPLPNIIFETHYNKDEEEYSIDINSDLSMQYNISDNARITANYNLLDEKLIQDDFDDTYTYINEKEQDINTYDVDDNPRESVGFEYNTSDNVLVSADYASNDIFSDNTYSTSVGLQYTDDAGKLTASYLLDKSEEMEEKVTGIEMDFTDLATLTASYKLYNPEVIKDQLQKESAWDLGLDLSLSELTSFSIGYELINDKAEAAENSGDELEDDEEDTDDNDDVSQNDKDSKKSSIEASLQFQF
ncbi:MAG: hypothetical protein ACOC1S_01950 [bacterium]